MAPTTRRARGAEQALVGHALTPAVLRDAGRLAAIESQPISDVRASARYRTLLVETLVTRALTRCLGRIRETAS